jgi:branched-chain amino acid transport system permease protein
MTVRPWHIAAWVGAAILLPLVMPSDYDRGLFTLAAIFALLGLSMNLVFGYLGYISFGQAAFFGLGAYVAALLNLNLGVNYWTAAALATLPAMALGAVVGFASARIGGVYFAITSLTVAEILRLIAANWIDLTRGPLGIVVPRPTIGFIDAFGYGFASYYLTLVILILGATIWLVIRLLGGAYGRAWLAIRESADLAEAVGIATLRTRVENIALSGGIAGLAGALIVPHVAIVSPELLSPHYSAMALLIVVLGGIGTIAGPIIGGILFAWLPELFRDIGDLRLAAFALLLLIVIRVQPDGIVAMVKRIGRSLRQPGTAVGQQQGEIALDGPTAVGSLPPSANGREPLLAVDGLTKHFRGVQALTAVSFVVHRGEILGLIGPNGAGKTTCMNVISGFLPATSGAVRFLGRPTSGSQPHDLARFGLIRTFQQTTLYGGLSALDNVLSGTHRLWPASALQAIAGTRTFHTIEAKRRAAALSGLERVGLVHRADVAAEDLPYGEQRLLALALALAAEPVLLLLDEPAAGLNPAEAANLGHLLRQLRGHGLTIILIEHNLRLVMSACDRLVVLDHGEKIAEGSVADVQRHPEVIRAYLGGVVSA